MNEQSGNVSARGGEMSEIDRLLTAEQHQVEEFIRLFQVPDLDLSVMVNYRWNLRDLLAHIVA